MGKQMQASISVGFGRENWPRSIDFVVEAEKLGVHSVWSAEAWGSDAVSPLAFVAARTSKILLGTGIMQAGSRSPALVGMTAMTMAALSGGRFLLGLGTSGPQVMEGWHGVRFERPVKRMREIAEIVRLVTSGERVAYSGRVYQLPLPGGEGKAIKSAMGPSPRILVYLATLGPKSLEMTGEIADGWLGTSFMPEHADVFFDHIRAGAQKAGRPFEEIDLHAGGVVAFSDDVESLLPPRKPGVAFTLGAMGSREHNFYNEAYQRAGYRDLAREVQGLWLEGRKDEATQMIPDEIVTQTNLLGSEEMVKARIRAYRDAGVTTIRVEPEGRGMEERLETLGRFMRLLGEVNGEAANE
ncbi:MAG: LLM class flavin-dependent oxidoreductase [Chloroflexota bacterium]|nr:LLM class flavin-dependent oxidoreductase [Chloroflexota bacterium]